MSRTYTPRPGSFAEKAVEHFRAHPDAEESSIALAALIECKSESVSALMQAAVANGLIATRREGRFCYFSLGTGEAVETDQPGADQEAEEPADHLTVALYNDGELLMSGIRGTEGFITLSASQTAQLREYLLHTGSLIEQLQQRTGAGE